MSNAFALVGNPNVGKTAVFNALTGLSLTTGNYPGVTVERKHGRARIGDATVEIVDLPGTYSLAARSPDEMIVADVLLDQQTGERPVDGLVAVIDASNLERNLYFLSQLLELRKPLIVALNMMDIADRRGIVVDIPALSARIGVPVVPVRAHKGVGIPELKQAIGAMLRNEVAPAHMVCTFPEAHTSAVQALAAEFAANESTIGRTVPELETFRILVDEEGYAEHRLARKLGPDFAQRLLSYRDSARENGATLAAQEARARYAWVKEVMTASVKRPEGDIHTRSERLDNLLTHRVAGTAIFVAVMVAIFQAIYAWAVPFMDVIDGGIGALGEGAGAMMPEGMLQSLMVDGVIAGVGSVLIFLPQILMLSFFIAVLEDFGYMARAAFLMDRLLGWCGLSGHSFIPMLSSFACAIPGIMSARTIQHRRDRFTTILVAPLMSCSARLPVYLIMIGAFIPANRVLGGLLGVQGLVLFGMYCLGVAVAVPVAWILRKTFFKGPRPPFLLEMPSYKTPQMRTVLKKMYFEGREFVVRAGTLIFAVTIVVWALAYFPRSAELEARYAEVATAAEAGVPAGEELDARLAEIDNELEGAYLRNSYLGRMGLFVEPVFAPLGWDWRIATAAIASFPAREIIIATLGTLFNMGADEDEESEGLRSTLESAQREDGTRLFNIPVAMSVMVFFALCCQCGATLAVIKRETGQWRWPLITFTYMTVLAYIGALLTYQGGMLLGLGG